MAWGKQDEHKLAQFLRAQYVLWCIGLLDDVREAKLSELANESGKDWKQWYAEETGLPPEGIRALWTILTEHVDEPRAIATLFRAFDARDDSLQ